MLKPFFLLSSSLFAAPLGAPPASPILRSLGEAPAPPAPLAQAAAPAAAVIVESAGAGLLSEAELFDRLALKDIVYVGERHDQALHHRVQLAALKALHGRRPGLRLGLEMLAAEQQPVLDDYLAGRVSEAEFAGFWSKNWGYDFTLYRPVLDFAKANGVPVFCLNAARELVRQTARGGLGSLTPAQRARLPASVAQTADARYLAYVKKSLAEHGPMDPVREGRMLEAQAVWNETMGDNAAAAAGRETPLLVLAGSGHMLYSAGVPESAARRKRLSQAVLLPYPLDGEEKPLPELLQALRRQGSEEIVLGDYFWLLPAE